MQPHFLFNAAVESKLIMGVEQGPGGRGGGLQGFGVVWNREGALAGFKEGV